MIDIALYGALGRMGRRIAALAAASDDVRIAAAVEAKGHPAVGLDLSSAAGIGDSAGVRVTDDEAAAADAAGVLVSFTRPEASVRHVKLAAERGKPAVVGTTGFSQAQLAEIRKAAGEVPIVLSPNMSVGVNVLMYLVRKAAEAFGPEYDAEVVEVHHRHKVDAPSGTALRLAGEIAAARGLDLEDAAVYGRKGHVGERTAGQIGIHAVRMGDVPGEHQVMFGTEGESFMLVHRATSRDSYAAGTLAAVRYVVTRPAGLYDMQDVIALAGK